MGPQVSGNQSQSKPFELTCGEEERVERLKGADSLAVKKNMKEIQCHRNRKEVRKTLRHGVKGEGKNIGHQRAGCPGIKD